MPRPNGYLLDTNIIVALVRDGPLASYLDRVYGLRAERHQFYAPIVVVGEAHSLARKWGWGAARVAKLKRTLARYPRLGIDSEPVLDRYADTDHRTTRRGRKMGKNDLWIAALARAYDLTLLTTDADFDHLHGAGLADIERLDPAAGP